MCPIEVISQRVKDIEAARISRLDLIGQIAMGMAHEIRNPLTVIKGYLQLQEKNGYYMGESLGIVFKEVSRIEALLTNFISLARNKAIKKTSQNLNHILGRFYPVIQGYAVRHGSVTELRLADNLPMLNLNTEEIEQLVMNLVCNGIEAMQVNSKLIIGTIRESSRVILYVQDEGSGIPSEHIEKIFDPFYTTKAGNTGLGLAIVLSIADRHQGQIEMFSKVGVGTVFRIIFPIVER